MNKIFILILFVSLLSLASANCPDGVYPCDSNIPNIISTPSAIVTTVSSNTSEDNTNSSRYWGSYDSQASSFNFYNKAVTVASLTSLSNIAMIDPLTYYYLNILVLGNSLANDKSLIFDVQPSLATTLHFKNSDITLGDWFNQAVKTTSAPTFDNLTITHNLTAKNICYSNGTNCQLTGNVDYTNIAMLNQSNNFNYNQTINGTLTINNISAMSSFSTPPTTAARNNYGGCVGFEFKVIQNITVSSLGRLYVSGNTQNHIIKLWDTTDTVTPIANATILASSTSDSDNFKWILITPVNLVTTKTYRIAIDETNGGDVWKDEWTVGSSMHNVFNTFTGTYGTSSLYPANLVTSGKMYDAAGMKFVITSPTTGTTTLYGTGITTSTRSLMVNDAVGYNLLAVTDNGNAGIGTITPGASGTLNSGARVFDIVGAIGQNAFVRILGGAGGTKGGLIIGNNDGSVYNYGQFTFDNALNTFTINQLYYAGYLGFGAGSRSSDLVILASNGNVGIGTTTPSVKLDVNGSASFNGTITSINASAYVNQVVCYATGGLLGHCSDVVNSTGGCTCLKN